MTEPKTRWVRTPCDTSACVEVGRLWYGDIAVRNSQFQSRTVTFSRREFAAFLEAAKKGKFDDIVNGKEIK